MDDDLQNLKYYGVILGARDYEVVSCASYSEATAHLGKSVVDFVVVSQGGPNFEGRTVLERVIEITRDTPVLVLTRCMEMNCYIETIQLGAVDYVEKPVHPADLVWIVETHMRVKGALSTRGHRRVLAEA